MKFKKPDRIQSSLIAVSAVSTVVALAGAIPMVLAQSSQPDTAEAVSLSAPGDGNVLAELRYDPFTDTVDRGMRGGRGGAGIGTPDIAYGQQDPVDTSVGGGAGGAGSVVRPGSRGSDQINTLGFIYVGYVSGAPPLAVVRFANGKEAVYSPEDSIGSETVRDVDAKRIKFYDGKMLALTPVAERGVASGTTQGARPGESPAPGVQRTYRGARGAAVGTPGSVSNALTSPASTLSGSSVPLDGPDAENVGHMPLSPPTTGIGPAGAATAPPVVAPGSH